jgi:hypothetical protein
LVYGELNPKTNYDIWALPLEGERKPRPILQTRFDERTACFSPVGFGQVRHAERPSDTGHTPFGDVFLSTSPDLIHWGCHRHVMAPKWDRGNWQSTKIGAGPVPLETPEGWLLIYHGVLTSCNGFVYSMGAAFEGADVVYPKSWAPFEVMQRRTELLKKSDKQGLIALEKECLANNATYKSWECDERKMKRTKKGNALYMHCLPADISGVSCAEGEVSKNVFEKKSRSCRARSGGR